MLLPLLQACGGRSDTEDYLFGSDGTAATGTGADGTGASSSSGARPSDEPGQGANGSGADGSGASSTGGKATGGTRPIGEGGMSTGGVGTAGTGQGGGSAGSPPGPAMSCGATTCDSTLENCCAGFAGFGCIPKSEECVGAVLSCTNSDHCPGNTVCCLKVIDADVGSGSQCKSACLGMAPQRERQLCQSDGECPFNHCRPTVFGVSVCTRQ